MHVKVPVLLAGKADQAGVLPQTINYQQISS